MSNVISVSAFASGLLLGVTAGIVLGLLLASQPGSRSRAELRDKLSEVPDTVRELTVDREKVYKEMLKKRGGQPLVGESYFED